MDDRLITLTKITQFIWCLLFAVGPQTVFAQADSTWQSAPTITLSGHADIFYAYDANQPQGTSRLPYIFNHNRHNEFNLNLGLIQVHIDHEKYRANVGLQTGVYAIDNYAAEPGLLKNIFQANVGLSLNTQNSLWLDVGVLPSYIGFESAISQDNPTLTRSLLAELSPYFMTGAKLTWNPSDKLEIGGLIANGWQRIQRVEGNSMLSIGTQVLYTPTENIQINWSTYIGTEDPDERRRIRYFNNFFGSFQLHKLFRLIVGFDIGHQQTETESDDFDKWLSPIIIGQVQLSDRWALAARIEYYDDVTGITVPVFTENGFQTTGYSVNVDYNPIPTLSCRLEGRYLDSRDAIFEVADGLSRGNFSIAASIAIKFYERLSK